MSIIYGYINLNSKPVERTVLETMKHALDFWGPDGEGLCVEDTCGIGNLLYFNTPEAIFEKMPFTDSTGNLVLSAGARIDNREELYTIFNVPLGQRLTMPDSALMLKAYEKWGEDCADHLVGDWAMAVWDKVKRKLFLARDHHGITALYYYKGEDFFVFSSSLKGILCLPQVPKKVNEYKIAQLLVNWNEGGPTTCYLDIMRLPPAHTLTLADGKVTTNRYWYLEHTPEVRLKNDQEYADMFLHLYTEAVRHRLRSHRPVGATLSSGLDSGSVCILAAKELAKEGKRLQAYTAVPLYDVPAPPGRIGNEGPYAQALAEKLGNVDLTLCNAENVGVLEGIRKKMEIHSQPGFAIRNSYWLVDILEKSNKSEIGTLLIGQSGNGTVSWPTIKILKNKNRKSVYLQLSRLKDMFYANYINRFFISNHLFEKYKFKNRLTSNYNILSSEQRIDIIKGVQGHLWCESGLFFKQEIRDPTLDIPIIKFLLGLPLSSDLIQNRQLFKINFHDYLSNSIIDGEVRGIQSIDINHRLKDEFNEVEKEMLSVSMENKYFFNTYLYNLNKLNQADVGKFLMLYSILLFFKKL